jgi:hypothetical protein
MADGEWRMEINMTAPSDLSGILGDLGVLAVRIIYA